MKPGGGRAKGVRFELAIVKRILGVFPNARRRAMQARGGREGADIENTPGFWIECGHGKRMDPVKKFAQAMNDFIANLAGYPTTDAFSDIPVAITQRDRGEPLVTMNLASFLTLVERGRRT